MIEERVIKKLEEAIRELEQGSLESPPADYATLRQMVGQRAGLMMAVDLIKDELKGTEDL